MPRTFFHLFPFLSFFLFRYVLLFVIRRAENIHKDVRTRCIPQSTFQRDSLASSQSYLRYPLNEERTTVAESPASRHMNVLEVELCRYFLEADFALHICS